MEYILAPAPIALVGFMIAIYAIVAAHKLILAKLKTSARPRIERAAKALEAGNALAPLIYGGALGPVVMPLLFEVSGVMAVKVPLGASILLGVAAGALSGSVWQIMHKVLPKIIARFL